MIMEIGLNLRDVAFITLDDNMLKRAGIVNLNDRFNFSSHQCCPAEVHMEPQTQLVEEHGLLHFHPRSFLDRWRFRSSSLLSPPNSRNNSNCFSASARWRTLRCCSSPAFSASTVLRNEFGVEFVEFGVVRGVNT